MFYFVGNREDNFEFHYCCTSCGRKILERGDLKNQCKEKHEKPRQQFTCQYCEYSSDMRFETTNHTSRHYENTKPKDPCTLRPKKVEPGHRSKKPTKYRRSDTSEGQEKLSGPNDGKDKREGKYRPPPPPTSRMTPAGRKKCQKFPHVPTNPLAKQSNRYSPRMGLYVIGEVKFTLGDDSTLEKRVTSTVLPVGWIKDVVEKLQRNNAWNWNGCV